MTGAFGSMVNAMITGGPDGMQGGGGGMQMNMLDTNSGDVTDGSGGIDGPSDQLKDIDRRQAIAVYVLGCIITTICVWY